MPAGWLKAGADAGGVATAGGEISNALGNGAELGAGSRDSSAGAGGTAGVELGTVSWTTDGAPADEGSVAGFSEDVCGAESLPAPSF